MTSDAKVHPLLRELHEAETDLAAEFREVAERTTDEPDVHHMCGTLAGQCDDHAAALRPLAGAYGLKLDGNGGSTPRAAARVCRVAVEANGDGHAAGPPLLDYLRELFLAVARVDLAWIVAGQVAQALRDPGLLALVTELHGQTRTQAGWLKTKIRELAPQMILTPLNPGLHCKNYVST